LILLAVLATLDIATTIGLSYQRVAQLAREVHL
jgi:hypothetical protein